MSNKNKELNKKFNEMLEKYEKNMSKKNNTDKNQSLGYDWYTNESKKKNIRNDTYFADACDLSRNKFMGKKVVTDKGINGFMPLSGSETHYNPKKWNKDYDDQLNHNCYAYFLDDLIHKRPKRPQPGHVDKGMNVFRKQDYTREEISRRAIYDNPSIYCTHPDNRCQKGYYKGVLVIDRYNNYHWLVQNSNGYWSHKPGQLEVTNIDAKGNLIKDPRKADLIYDKDRQYSLIYSDVGPFFCVPNQDDTGIKKRSATCGQCGGGIRKNNKSGLCTHCK
jgi:hypothetical protein